MKLSLEIGESSQTLEIESKNLLTVLTLENSSRERKVDEREILKQAMENPVGVPRIEEMVGPGKRVAIVVSDNTRPLPTARILPVVLQSLEKARVRREDITILFALGNHKCQSKEEQERLVGMEIYDRFRCVDSCVEGYQRLGETSRKTPVILSKTLVEADVRICIGNVEYHYFAGYSGGAKAVMPGCAARESIQANHSMMVENTAMAGRLEGNPVREDIEEAVSFCPIHFLLNVVLDTQKRVIYAAAGHFREAHRCCCRFLDTLYRVPIEKKGDIVIASMGGWPKDRNLYQTQKALENAKYAVKRGGIIILVGSCREGLGEKTFEEWMTQAQAPEELIMRIKREFCLGGHKAAAIALVMEKANIFMVSELEEDLVKSIFMRPFRSVQEAYDEARRQMGEEAQVIVMPYAGSTLPTTLDIS